MKESSKLLSPKCTQGNLNPYLLTGALELVQEQTTNILHSMNRRPGYIFNLGHGVLPATPTENVAAVVETVHSFKRG